MPWSVERYPPAMRHLPAFVRLTAIAIANAVLAEDGDEGKAIRVGIAKAKQWAEDRSTGGGGADVPRVDRSQAIGRTPL